MERPPETPPILEISADLAPFVTFVPLSGSLTHTHRSAGEANVRQLRELRKQYTSKFKPPKNKLPTLPSCNLSRLPSRILFVYLYGRQFVEQLETDYHTTAKAAITHVSQLETFVKTCIHKSFDFVCDFDAFGTWVSGQLRAQNFVERKKHASLMSKWLDNKLSGFLEFETDPIFLQQLCQSLEDTIVPNEEFCPINDLELELGLFFQSKGMTKELYRIVQRVSNGNTKCLEDFIARLQRKLQLKTHEQEIVLRNSIWRIIFDVYYVFNPSFLMSGQDDQFAEKCTFISSLSPAALGLSESLFTAQQMDTPIMNLVKENKQIKEISEEFSILHFFTCPIDVLWSLQKCISMITQLARSVELEKKLGPFMGMVEDEQVQGKRARFMSFDDLFSLFFAILAADPPRNAVALCDCLKSIPDGLMSQQRSHARATFVGAVEHILGFTEEQLVKVEEDIDDPLGVSKKG